jgi:hypothetical protein
MACPPTRARHRLQKGKQVQQAVNAEEERKESGFSSTVGRWRSSSHSLAGNIAAQCCCAVQQQQHELLLTCIGLDSLCTPSISLPTFFNLFPGFFV